MLQFDGDKGAETLQDELRAATEFRNLFLDKEEDIISQSYGGWYRSDKRMVMPVVDNFAFEYKTSTLPMLMYDNPQCVVTTKSPHKTDSQGQTLRQYARSLELGLNAWSSDNNISGTLREIAVDFMYSWGVAWTSTNDQPGWQGMEMAPQQPVTIRLSNRHYLMDPKATTWLPMAGGSPRYHGHIWRSDLEDLMDNDSYDPEAIESLEVDTSCNSKNDTFSLGNSGFPIPKRREVIAWDVWVPERGWTDHELALDWGIDNPRCVNGTIYSIGCAYTDKGLGGRGVYLRKPRPAYVPPWGPYTVFGYDKIKDMPYPLSILIATGEQAYAVNAHAVQISEDSRKYRRFAAASSGNKADAEKYRIIPHGAVGLFDDVDKIKQMEAGGVTDQQLKQYELAQQRLDRAAALSATRRGSAKSHTTATAESIADAGTRTKMAGLQSAYRSGVTQVLMTAAWFMHHGEDVMYELGEKGEEYGIEAYYGGSEFPFESLSLQVVPYSHEHTDRTVMQRSIMDAIQTAQGMAQVIAQYPFMRASMEQLTKRLFEVTNVPFGDELVDDESYEAFLALQQMQMAMKYEEPNQDVGMRKGGKPEAEPVGNVPPLQSRVKGFLNDAMSETAQAATLEGAAAG